MARNRDTHPGSFAPNEGEPGEGGAAGRALSESFRVRLPPFRPGEPPFEGPLDLILHLVKEHEVDLFDIPVAAITESYLGALESLRELDIDVASEFLQMAAQLLLMKSKMLLPRTEVAEDAAASSTRSTGPRLSSWAAGTSWTERSSPGVHGWSAPRRRGRKGSPTSRCSSSSRRSIGRSRTPGPR